jgi:hypothetical protein
VLGGILFSASVLDFACGGGGGGGGAGTNLGPIGVTMNGIPSGADTVHHPTAQAEIYNPASGPLGAFTSLTATMVQARAAAGAVLLKDGSVLFTGGLIRGAGPSFRVIINTTEEEFVPINAGDYLELDFTIPGQQIAAPPVCNGTTTACTNTSCISCVCYTTISGDTVETIASSLNDEINATGSILATAGISATIDNTFGNVLRVSESGNSGTTSVLSASVNPTPVAFTTFSETVSIPESASSSAERFSPISQTFRAVGAMNFPRVYHTSARLNDGTVLVAGGAEDTVPPAPDATPSAACIPSSPPYPGSPPYVAFQAVSTAEIYNPGPQTFSVTGSLNTARASAGSAVLSNGTVLIAGGIDASGNSLSSVEIYNPRTGTFTLQHVMSKPRSAPIVTVLDSGEILIAGGDVSRTPCYPYASSNLPNGVIPFTWEIYDPVAGSTTSPPNLSAPMSLSSESFAASSSQLSIAGGALLLLSGGIQPDETTDSSNFGDLTIPDVESYTSTINSGLRVLNSPRAYHQMTVLDTGKVLITGGVENMDHILTESSDKPVVDPLFDPSAYLNTAELYDDSTEPATSTPLNDMQVKRALHSAIKLLDGTVLIAGGYCCGATTTDPDFECTPSTQCP